MRDARETLSAASRAAVCLIHDCRSTADRADDEDPGAPQPTMDGVGILAGELPGNRRHTSPHALYH